MKQNFIENINKKLIKIDIEKFLKLICSNNKSNHFSSNLLPVRVWTDKFIPLEYEIVKNGNGYELWGKVERANAWKKRRFIKTPLTWRHRSRRTCYDLRVPYKEIGDWVWVRLHPYWNKRLAKIAPSFIIKNNILWFKIPRKFIGIWKSINNAFSIIDIFPKEIIIREDIFWSSCGLLEGEMTKNKHFIEFTNGEPSVIKHILNFFDLFLKIKPEEFSWRIKCCKNNLRGKNKKYIIKLWLERCKLDLSKLTNFDWYNLIGTHKKKLASFGVVRIFAFGVLREWVLSEMLRRIKNIISEQKNWCLHYLKGIIAAEGGVHHTGCLYVAAIRKSQLNFYLKLLEKIEITAHISGDHNILISGWDNLYKLHKHDIFSLHDTQKEKFIKAFNKNIDTKIMFSFDTLMNEIQSKDTKTRSGYVRKIKTEVSKLSKKGFIDENLIDKLNYRIKNMIDNLSQIKK